MYISKNDVVSCLRIKGNQIVDITGKQWDTSKVAVGKGLINPQAIQFSNYGDYMFTKNAYSDLDFDMNDFTIAAWFRLDKVSSFVGLICRKNYFSSRVGLTFDSTYYPYISTGNGNTNIYQKATNGYSGGYTCPHCGYTQKRHNIYIR